MSNNPGWGWSPWRGCRAALVALFALALLPSGAPAEPGPGKEIAGGLRLFRQVNALLHEVDQGLRVAMWGNDVLSAAARGRVPPNSPTDALKLDAQLDRVSGIVREIGAPEFDAPLPPAATATDRHQLRKRLRESQAQLGEAVMECLASRQTLGLLDNIDQSLEALRDLLDKLNGVYADALAHGASYLPIVNEKLKWAWVDIATGYLPRIGGMRADLGSKRIAAANAVRQRITKLEEALSSQEQELAREREELGHDLAQIARNQAVLEAWQTRNHALKESRDRVSGEVEAFAARLRDLNQAKEASQQQLMTARKEAEQAREQAQSWQSRAHEAYTSCPKGASYADCTHRDLKKAYNDRRSEARARLNDAQARARASEARIVQLKTVLEKNAQQQEQLRETLAAAQNRLRAMENELAAQTAGYQLAFLEAMRHVWESRAEAYLAENQQATSQAKQHREKLREAVL